MPRPNLLFLMSDQQRADTVDPSTPCLTPNLDRLAARGTRFDRCHTVNPICSPTRASLMTGLLPHSHGMVDCTHTVDTYRAKLKPDLPFWSRRLKGAGYRTGYFGKWHVERSEELGQFGWDVYDTRGQGHRQFRESLGLAPQPSHAVACHVQQKGYRDNLLYAVVDEPAEGTRAHYTYQQGIDFLGEATAQPDPWCCFISTTDPHDPYVTTRDYYERYNPADIPKPPSFDDDLADRPGIYRRLQSVWRDLEWEQFAEATACYQAMCSHLDDQVGRVLRLVEEAGQLDNTIVVYTSDHGDYMGDHRLFLKGIAAFEGAYRIPMIMAGPGVPDGRVIDNVCSILDLPSALTELTIGEPFEGEGRSLRTLFDSNSEWDNQAFAEMHGQRFFCTQRLLWRDQYKYVFNGFDEDELYDLDADPHELRNLAADPAHRTVAEDLAGRMWDIIVRTDDFNMHKAQYGMFRFAPVGPEGRG